MVIVEHYNLILNWMMMMMMTGKKIKNKSTVWKKKSCMILMLLFVHNRNLNWISLTIFLMILNLEMHQYQLYEFDCLEDFYIWNKKNIYINHKNLFTPNCQFLKLFKIEDYRYTWPRYLLSSRLYFSQVHVCLELELVLISFLFFVSIIIQDTNIRLILVLIFFCYCIHIKRKEIW